MFPLDPPTVFHLVLTGVVLFSALALRFRWRWRFPLLLLAIALPTGLLWSDPPTGQYAELGYIAVVGASIVMLILGAIWGGVMRLARVVPWMSVAVLIIAAGASASFALWHQYVPSACLETPLSIQIAGKTLHLPPELRPRLENGDSIGHFGRIDRKTDYARFCRMSRNGTRSIDMDTVWITPASNHQAITSACNVNEPPAWCNGYSPDPYRHIGKILIAPNSEPAFPLPYWSPGSLKKDRQGDLIQGSVCLLPDADSVTQCWTWRPFGDGAHLVVSTYNLDRTFAEMPVEEAREIIRHARDTLLAIITP